jgi:hypothetical protein
MILICNRKKIKKASSGKQRLTAGEGYCRMDLERINYDFMASGAARLAF